MPPKSLSKTSTYYRQQLGERAVQLFDEALFKSLWCTYDVERARIATALTKLRPFDTPYKAYHAAMVEYVQNLSNDDVLTLDQQYYPEMYI